MYNKICKICGKDFQCRDKRTEVCSNENCKKEFLREKYKNDTKDCICSFCGKHYQATRRQNHSICKECISMNEKYVYKNTYEQNHRCRKCKKLLYVETKNLTRQDALYDIYDKTCDDCKKINLENSRIRMILNNPNSDKHETIEEAELAKKEKQLKIELNKKYKSRDELLKAFSERMKTNNPMKNKEVRDKMALTYKNRVKSGEIVIDRTKHKNYKGDRGIKNYLRMAIKPWGKYNLEKNDYTCQICGKKGCTLNVHHIEKFSDIVEKFASELDLDLKTLEHNSNKYLMLEKVIVDYHNDNDIGLVVCENCHDKIDKAFHKRKSVE